ncbi:MAG: hypothetical protein HYY58_04765, partial [Candidatus Omnitrophica bacterium]|nr:hypothetical protein [Candidatus Omnitrophota bacterium]
MVYGLWTGSAEAATKYWVGGTANSTITADPNVGGLDIKAGYTGTIATKTGEETFTYRIARV